MSNPETILRQQIRLRLGRDARHARLFPNPSGLFWAGKRVHQDGTTVTLAHATQIQAGLIEGAGDMIGWTTLIVTPEMVGKPIAVFTSAEVKTKNGRLEDGQPEWAQAVLAAGGRAAFVRSEEDALQLVALP